jgi:hypothetical protein
MLFLWWVIGNLLVPPLPRLGRPVVLCRWLWRRNFDARSYADAAWPCSL